MKRLSLVAIGLAILVAGTVIWLDRPRSSATQPLPAGVFRGANVLLVTIDTLRADHVGAYRGGGTTTPALDALAREGLRFERTYAHAPLTLPSHASLLTGRYPTRTGVHDN